MQKLPFTARKGFVFSVDATVSAILLLSVIFFITAGSFQDKSAFDNQLESGNDAITAINKTGFLTQTLDTNSLSAASDSIRQKMLQIIPANLEARIELKKYDLNTSTCRSGQTFESCFLESPPQTAASGPEIPETEVFSSKKIVLLGQEATQCDLDVALMPAKQKIKNGTVLFSENEQVFLQEQQSPVDIDFNVSVNPQDILSCDQNVTVTLTVSIPEIVRPPIDMMLVIDKSGSMSWGGRLSTSDAKAVWVSGNNAFIADGYFGVRSANTSAPLVPSLLDTYDPGTIIDVYGDGNYVFLADTASTDEIIAINATNPSNMQETDQLNFDAVYGLFVSNGYAYVAGERANANDSGLVIVDVRNPNNITRLGNIDSTDPNDVFVDGNYAYFADGSAGLRVYDVTNKNSIQLRDTENTAGDAVGVFKQENYAYVADGANGLVVVNVATPTNIFTTDSINTPGYANNVFVDGNYAYVADDTNILRINVSNKNDIFIDKFYQTPYSNYTDIFVQNNMGYISGENNGNGVYGMTVIDLVNGEKMANAKDSAKEFVDFNGWQLPPDQIGLVSFNSSATLNHSLTTSKTDLNAAINLITSNGGTNIESGLNSANSQLTGPNANPNAMKFEVLLSDGQSTSGNSQNAAQNAANAGITIFTIGFGGDAYPPELITIAGLTGGEYYSASDANALQAIFDIIAQEISERASDVNVLVPSLGGATVINQGEGELVDGNLLFNVGEISPQTPWTQSYTLNFPCDNSQNCETDAISFPGEGTILSYLDSNGLTHTIDFNVQQTVDFYKRNLSIQIVSGNAVSDTEVYLDVLVENTDELDANSVEMDFLLNDLNGQLLTTAIVPALCSESTPQCTQSSTTLNSIHIPTTGKIYATIGNGAETRECPLENTDAIFCGTGTPMEFIEAKYYIWRK